MKSGCVGERSGGSFCRAMEVDTLRRLKVMHSSSGRGRNKSQTDSWS